MVKEKTDVRFLGRIMDLRPLSFISSLNKDDVINVGVYANYFFIKNSNQIVLEITKHKYSTSQQDDLNFEHVLEEKDTLVNLYDGKRITFNIPFTDLLFAVNKLSSPFPHSKSELIDSGLSTTRLRDGHLDSILINECPISVVCSLSKQGFVDLNDETRLAILDVVDFFVDSTFDMETIKQTIGRKCIFHFGSAGDNNKFLGQISLTKVPADKLGDYIFISDKGNVPSIIPEKMIDLVQQAIIDAKSSDLVSEVIKSRGSDYVNFFYDDLIDNLFSEFCSSKSYSISSDVSLSDFDYLYPSRIDINGISSLVSQISRIDFVEEDVINLVFPVRNANDKIYKALEYLFNEIEKSVNINFRVVLHINNTTDSTLDVALSFIDKNRDLVNKVNMFIIESPRDVVTSLSGSLDMCHTFLTDKISSDASKNNYFSFWDDELEELICFPESLFNSNLNLLKSSPNNKIISGYMVDSRNQVSLWHNIAKGFSADLRFVHSKPYVHGGAGMIMRFEDYAYHPKDFKTVADTFLCAHSLQLVPIETLRNLSHENWPVRLNSNAPVFHPIEENILLWTVKYLMYYISWENTFNYLNSINPELVDLWKSAKRNCKLDFHKKIDSYVKNLSPDLKLQREFMHSYYRALEKIDDKEGFYNSLKSLRERSYI
ncbi:hypothetical protein JXA48_03800 [Candidatus Woesearchaeota archaeon]|nr:hypothetical protein [Candidatus Woesearchaeota archaeon]